MNQLTVLHINKYHHMVGGSEAVYFKTAEILENHGHKSLFFSMKHPENSQSKTKKYFMPYIDIEKPLGIIDYLLLTGRNLYSFKARRLISRLLDDYHVDLVHIHNIHRQMSPSILYEFRKRNIPVVMTLHEYKMICPSYIMMCRNKPCEACTHGKYYNAIKHRCVKKSLPRSGILAVEMYLHHKMLDIYKNVDIFIAPSMFLKNKHEEMGFNKNIVHLPLPLDTKVFNSYLPLRKSLNYNKLSFVYFGRLSPDKGLYTLLEATRILSERIRNRNYEVSIIGDGPIKNDLIDIIKRQKLNNVYCMGFLKGGELFNELVRHHVAVLPSEWYENYPVSVMESFGLGIPVIGSDIGGIPEMVKDRQTGLMFESANAVDLSNKMEYVAKNPQETIQWGVNARDFVERELNTEKYYQSLTEIYQMALDKHTQ